MSGKERLSTARDKTPLNGEGRLSHANKEILAGSTLIHAGEQHFLMQDVSSRTAQEVTHKIIQIEDTINTALHDRATGSRATAYDANSNLHHVISFELLPSTAHQLATMIEKGQMRCTKIDLSYGNDAPRMTNQTLDSAQQNVVEAFVEHATAYAQQK